MNLKNPLERMNLVIWQPLAGYLVSLTSVLALLTYRLGSLVPGFSTNEQQAIVISKSIESIVNNPLFAPHSFLQYIGLKTGHFGFWAMRLPSVAMALACAVAFYFVVLKWFNFRVATITTVLFITSSWFITLGRIATPEISTMSLMIPLAYAIWLPKTKRPLLALIIGAFVVTGMLYIPGFVWFAVAGIIWQRKNILHIWRNSRTPALFVIFGCLALLAPLIIALAGSSDLAKEYIGLPVNVSETIREVPKNIALTPVRLIIRGPVDASTNLGQLPLLDFFTTVMAIIGAYAYAVHRKLRRSKLLFAVLVFGTVLASLGGAVSLAVLLPFIFLLVAGGIHFMLEQWFKIFPYNPLARSLATILVFVALATTVFYHINRYYIAWPQAPVTKQTYSQSPRRP